MGVQRRTINDFLDWLAAQADDAQVLVRAEDPFEPRLVDLEDPKERDTLVELWKRERASV